MNAIKYLKGVANEIYQIQWPSKGEIMSACIIVSVVSMIFGCILLLMDIIIMYIFSAILI